MITNIVLVMLSILVLRNTLWISTQIDLAEEAADMIRIFEERERERDGE